MSRHRSRTLRAYVLAAVASVILIPAGNAGVLDIQQVSLFTVKNWQGGVLETNPYEFWVMVHGDDITSGTLTTPGGGTTITLVESMGFWVSDEDVRYATLDDLRDDFPIGGDYTFSFNGGVDFVTVSTNPVEPTPEDVFINVTYPSNGAINVPLNPTFTWEQYTGSGNNLYMDVGDEEDTLFIQSATNPPSTISWTPGTLVPGHLHSFEIAVQSITTTYDVTTSCGDKLTFCDIFDYNNEILFTTVDPTVIPVEIDIKPESCPNPLKLNSKGVLPVAVLGTEGFDVTQIDPATVTLSRVGIEEGVSPLRWAYEDVATPFEGELCDCHTLGPDGLLDLTLKFKVQELVEKLELADIAGETIPLTLTGNLKEEFDGTPIHGGDCVWVLE